MLKHNKDFKLEKTTWKTEDFELTKLLDALPSTGIVVLYSLYKLIGPLSRKSIFGFGFTDHIGNNKSAHYFEKFKVSMNHNWEKEKELFYKITQD